MALVSRGGPIVTCGHGSDPEMVMNTLADKVAVVTGAAQGLGSSFAKNLAAAGAAVVVNYYPGDGERAAAVVAGIEEAGGKAIALPADVTKASDLRSLFDETVRVFGAVDILVNNAGVYAFGPLEETTEQDFHYQFNTNVLGVLLASKEAVKHFGPEGGSIVNISTAAAQLIQPNLSVYTATKTAVEAITRVLAKELGPRVRFESAGHSHSLMAATSTVAS